MIERIDEAVHEAIAEFRIDGIRSTKKKSKKKWWLIGIAFLVVLGAGGGYWAYRMYSINHSPRVLLQKGLLAQKSGRSAIAISYYNQVIAADPSNKGNYATYAYYNLGVEYMSSGKSVAALRYYSSAIQSDPTYLPALFNLAVGETSTNPTVAIADYNKILALAPHNADTLFNAGLLNEQLGNVKLAISLVKEAISYDPSLATRVPASFPLHT